MLTITQAHYIRKLYFDKGKTLKEIERGTGHNYRTIKKYIDQDDFNKAPKRLRDLTKAIISGRTYMNVWRPTERLR